MLSDTWLVPWIGARAISMGGTYTSVSDDPSAIYWNPAGLSQIHQKSLGFFDDFYKEDNNLFLEIGRASCRERV
jgi:hypothetical protein